MQFLANLIATILERAFGSKPSTLLTITGLIGALSAALSALPATIVPAKYQPWLVGSAAFFSLLAGALGYGHNPTQQVSQPASQPASESAGQQEPK